MTFKLKGLQENTIKDAMSHPYGRGYVLDFSDRTIPEFFEDEFSMDFDDQKYIKRGSSKCNRLLTLLELETPQKSVQILRTLWDRREGLIRRQGITTDHYEEEKIKNDYFKIIAKIENQPDVISTKALESFKKDRTLDELIKDITRDLEVNKPEVAMDHLHTYCMKKFTHLLKTRGIQCSEKETLNARFGKYRNALNRERELTNFTNKALKAGVELLENFNDVRNNHSLAHDNKILEPAEARYIFENLSSLLIFVRSIEAGRYSV